MTEIRKQANRLNFGEIEADAYQDDLGFSMGLLKKGGKGSGGIRAAQVNKATNARMSQKLQKQLAKQQQVRMRCWFFGVCMRVYAWACVRGCVWF